MSLIDFIFNYGNPIFVTDLALTSLGEIDPFILPSHKIEFDAADFPEQRHPYTLALKSIIIKDTLCVGAAGAVHAIVGLFDEIQDFFLHRDITLSNVKEFHRAYKDKSADQELDALIAVCTTEGDQYTLSALAIGNIAKSESPVYDQIFGCGTGFEDWTRTFTQQSLLSHTGGQASYGNLVQAALLSCMYYFEEERNTPENLQNGWGGGFDLIVLQNQKFQRFGPIAYLFWTVDTSMDEWELKPTALIRFSYKDNNLFIQHFSGEYRSYGIREINSRDDISKGPTISDFEAFVSVSCVWVMSEGELKGKVFSVNGLATGMKEPVINVIDVNGYAAFGWSKRLEEELLEVVRQAEL